jgi:formiminoglutamase/agmatinase
MAQSPDGAVRFALIGVPFDGGASLGWPGSRYGPEEIRRALRWIHNRIEDGRIYSVELERTIAIPDDAITDAGDVNIVAHDVVETGRRVTDAVREALAGGRRPVVVGGDDSVTFPAIRALHDAVGGPIGLIHLDAHFDLLDYNERQGRFSHSSGIRRALELDRLAPRHVIQIGVRNFNFPSSAQFIRERGIAQISARRFHEMGPAAAAARALSVVADTGAVFVALDMDALDAAHAPGAGAFEPGGLTAQQVLEFLRRVAPATHALCVVETNPLTDFRGMTAMVAAECVMHYVVASLAAGTTSRT